MSLIQSLSFGPLGALWRAPVSANGLKWLSENVSQSGGEEERGMDGDGNVVEESADDSNDLTEEDIVKRLEATEKESAQYKEKYVRALAEMENVRARARTDVENSHRYGIRKFALSLLEVADNLSRALGSVPEDIESLSPDQSRSRLAALVEGVKLTEGVLQRSFKQFKVVRFDSLGEVFNPQLHDAVFQSVCPDIDAGKVFHVVKEGYMLQDRVLRPAQVGVSSGDGTKGSETEV
uniref:GrpE protein homolog n=1 Tax=Stygiella incarcerata TaxID=1712417 RepID=A0A192ZJ80_9EUKA|nr:Mge1 [Stygiella incarcerata]